MRTNLLLLFFTLLFLNCAFAGEEPNFGIGFRLGEPSGLTFKKYNSSTALELSIGRAYVGRNVGWYNEGFVHYYNNHYNYAWYEYTGVDYTTPLGLQLHYLFQKPIDISKGSLNWYYGLGAQFRWMTITYYYKYQVQGNPFIYSEKDTYVNMDLGLDGVIGIEYTLDPVPISIFLDATLFMEVYDTPFAFWYQGGFGARYNF